jgi:hypothetical protein
MSIIIIGLTILTATFWEVLGFGSEQTPYLVFPFMIAFGLNVAGLIFAFAEKKVGDKKYRIGLFGHLILIIGFFALNAYALMTMN